MPAERASFVPPPKEWREIRGESLPLGERGDRWANSEWRVEKRKGDEHVRTSAIPCSPFPTPYSPYPSISALTAESASGVSTSTSAPRPVTGTSTTASG